MARRTTEAFEDEIFHPERSEFSGSWVLMRRITHGVGRVKPCTLDLFLGRQLGCLVDRRTQLYSAVPRTGPSGGLRARRRGADVSPSPPPSLAPPDRAHGAGWQVRRPRSAEWQVRRPRI